MEEGEHGQRAEQPSRKRQESDGEGRGLWMLLPTDVLLLVFARLTAVDLIRAGAVCVSWRKALKTKGRRPPRTILPWLMIHEDLMGNDHRCGFLDPNTGETYRIPLPGLRRKHVVGKSDDGFLVLEEPPSSRLVMINPITRATVAFPPLPASRLLCAGVNAVRYGSDYTVVVSRYMRLLSAFAGDDGSLENWRRVSSALDDVHIYRLHARGKQLCGLLYEHEIDDYRRFFTCDLDSPTDLKVWVSGLPCDSWSLADFGGSFPDHRRDHCRGNCFQNCCVTNLYPMILPNGDPIVVCEALLMSPPRTIAVKVYRMPDDLRGEPAMVTSIGNYAVFLGYHDAVVLSALDSPELKPGTIYFGYPCGLVDNDGAGWSSDKDLVVFDVEAQSFSVPVKSYDSLRISSWFVPIF